MRYLEPKYIKKWQILNIKNLTLDSPFINIRSQ